MAGNPPMSAFAARKQLLARTAGLRSKSASEDDSGTNSGAGYQADVSGNDEGRRAASSKKGGNDEVRSVGSGGNQRKRQRLSRKASGGDGNGDGGGGKKFALRPSSQADAGADESAGDGEISAKRKVPKEGVSRSPGATGSVPASAVAAAMDAAAASAMDVDGDVDLDVDEDIQGDQGDQGFSTRGAVRRETSDALESMSASPLAPPTPKPSVELQHILVSPQTLKNCVKKKSNGIIELRLDADERLKLPIVGQYGIRVIRGEVFIAGATLRPSSDVTWVQSSLCYSVPILRCPESSVVELHQHPASGGLRRLGRLSPLFRTIWHRTGSNESPNHRAYKILSDPDDLPRKATFRPLTSPPEWNKKLADLADTNPSGPLFICGPRNSGKSTFARLATNRFLTVPTPQRTKSTTTRDIAVLDLDPGQSEFCPPGTISLVHVSQPNLSSPFAHPWPDTSSSQLIRCHALASATPGPDPELYLSCALDLYAHYQRTPGLALVVNTPGWILGTGLDLLCELIARTRPAEVVYMSEDGPTETIEGLRSACRNTKFSTLPSQQGDTAGRRSAADLRAMQTMAYFHSAAGGRHLSWNAAPLSSVPPWRVSYAGANRGFAGIICYAGHPGSTLLAEAINGMVLAVVEIEDEKAFQTLSSHIPQSTLPEDAMDLDSSSNPTNIPPSVEKMIRRTPDGIPYFQQEEGETLDPAYARTVGLALVRGVDKDSSALQLLTPIPRGVVEDVRQNGRFLVLVHGQFDAPTWAYTEDLYERETGATEAEARDDNDDEDDGESDGNGAGGVGVVGNRPWVEGVDRSRRRRQAGGGAWRVRRDLGRHGR